MTTIEVIGAVTDIVGALATVLVAVGIFIAARQLKYNVSTTLLDSSFRLGELALAEVSNHDDSFFADLYGEPDQSPKVLRRKIFVMTQLIFMEFVWGARASGEIRDVEWKGWVDHIHGFVTLSDAQTIWQSVRESFTPDFREFVDTLVAGRTPIDPAPKGSWRRIMPRLR